MEAFEITRSGLGVKDFENQIDQLKLKDQTFLMLHKEKLIASLLV